jgi:hypothetical protein
LEILEENGDLSPEELVYRTNVQVELYKLYVEEEPYWYQRGVGYYFHRIANGRKRKTQFNPWRVMECWWRELGTS